MTDSHLLIINYDSSSHVICTEDDLDTFHRYMEACSAKTWLEVMKIIGEQHFLQLWTDYNGEHKLTDGMKESLFYQKVMSVQSTPIEITVKEIKRGINDGSIRAGVKPQMIYLNAWALVIGFMKLNDTSASSKMTIMRIDVQEWKEYMLEECRNMIKS